MNGPRVNPASRNFPHPRRDDYPNRVPFRIRVEAPLARVPAVVRKKLESILQLVASDLEGISEGPLLESLSLSGLIVDVRGWRFGYRVDPDRRALIVESVSLPPS